MWTPHLPLPPRSDYLHPAATRDKLGQFLTEPPHDLQGSARNLAARGIEVHNVADSPDILEIERESTFGARIWAESA